MPLSRPGRTLVGHRSLDRMMAGRIGACLHVEPLLHALVCEPAYYAVHNHIGGLLNLLEFTCKEDRLRVGPYPGISTPHPWPRGSSNNASRRIYGGVNKVGGSVDVVCKKMPIATAPKLAATRTAAVRIKTSLLLLH